MNKSWCRRSRREPSGGILVTFIMTIFGIAVQQTLSAYITAFGG